MSDKQDDAGDGEIFACGRHLLPPMTEERAQLFARIRREVFSPEGAGRVVGETNRLSPDEIAELRRDMEESAKEIDEILEADNRERQ